jgi:hypothetical protein
MKKQLYHYQKKKHEYDSYNWLICEVFGLAWEDIFWAITDCGIEYVDILCGRDLRTRAEILYGEDYWLWWINQWNIRNERFVAEMGIEKLVGQPIAKAALHALFDKYLSIHRDGTYGSNAPKVYAHKPANSKNHEVPA